MAVETVDCLLIIDDLKGCKLADALGIKTTGTFGVILAAKFSGKLDSVKPLLSKIKQTDFRLSENLEKQILEKANEI